MEHLDPALVAALRLDEAHWKLGDRDATVTTESGSCYIVHSDGGIVGPRFIGRLNGAVYRVGGPIRTNLIVYGMRMELRSDLQSRPGVRITTPVVAIEDLPDEEAE